MLKKLVIAFAFLSAVALIGFVLLMPYKRINDIKENFGLNVEKSSVVEFDDGKEGLVSKFYLSKKNAEEFLNSHKAETVKTAKFVQDYLTKWGLRTNECDAIVELSRKSETGDKKSESLAYFFINKGDRYLVYCSLV